jgi:hypothetical protein
MDDPIIRRSEQYEQLYNTCVLLLHNMLIFSCKSFVLSYINTDILNFIYDEFRKQDEIMFMLRRWLSVHDTFPAWLSHMQEQYW